MIRSIIEIMCYTFFLIATIHKLGDMKVNYRCTIVTENDGRIHLRNEVFVLEGTESYA